MLTIAIFNAKGGVGKTTTAYNLACGLVKFHGLKTLLVDCDPQGHSSVALGLNSEAAEHTLKDVLLHRLSIDRATYATKCGVHIVPANILLAEEEIPITGLPGRELLLRKALLPIAASYDICIIDCPPNLGIFSINSLMAATVVIVPVSVGAFELFGVKLVERILEKLATYLDHQISTLRILATHYSARDNLSPQVFAALERRYGESLCDFYINSEIALRYAAGQQQSIFDYDKNCKSSASYRQLVEEVAGYVKQQ